MATLPELESLPGKACCKGIFSKCVRRYPRWPWLQSNEHNGKHRFRAPTLGEHNYEILSGELELLDDEIVHLGFKNIIGIIPRGLG